VHDNSRFIVQAQGNLDIDHAEFIGLSIDAMDAHIIVHRSMIEQTVANVYREHSNESLIGINQGIDSLGSLNILGMITNCGFNSTQKDRYHQEPAEPAGIINARLTCLGTRKRIIPETIDKTSETTDPLGDLMGKMGKCIGFANQIEGFCDLLNDFMDRATMFEAEDQDNDSLPSDSFVPI